MDSVQLQCRANYLENVLKSNVAKEAMAPWVLVVYHFHTLMRRVLILKKFFKKRKELREKEWEIARTQIILESTWWTEEDQDWLNLLEYSTVNSYLSPPNRRVVDAVWLEVSKELKVSVGNLRQLMLGAG